MTSNEIIAMRLFGWVKDNRPLPPNVERGYVLPGTVHRCSVTCNQSVASFSYWPDLTDWNWIRRMEDALAERGLGKAYAQTLCGAYPELLTPDEFDAIAAPCLRCTASQRVAAAVKVLEVNA